MLTTMLQNFDLARFSTLIATIYLVLEWALRALALLVVPRRRPPSSGTAWLMLIFLLPVPGWLLFLFLGTFKLPDSRRSVQRVMNRRIESAIAQISETSDNASSIIDPVLPRKYQSLEGLVQHYGRLPSLAGNQCRILSDYDDVFVRLARDIRKAQTSVHVEYYAITLDDTTRPVLEALAEARGRGVDVRVLFDDVGSHKYGGRRAMKKFFKEHGINYRIMLPVRLGRGYVRPDLRNHRKIVVIDNDIAYTGSQNLIDRHYERKDDIYYDELVIRLRGPVVTELAALFVTDWVSEGGTEPERVVRATGRDAHAIRDERRLGQKSGQAIMQVLPSGPGFPGENNLRAFVHLLHLAEREITIVNPYFVPPESLIGAITSASERGVRVRMVNSAAIDQLLVGYAQRSYYELLLNTGVEIYLYDAPILLHSKFIAVDGEVTVIGSSNLDIRSFELDSELSLIVYDTPVTKKMERQAETYITRSKRLTLKHWNRRPYYKKVIESLARLTSAVQ